MSVDKVSWFERSEPAKVRRVVLQIILLVAGAAAVVWLLYALRSVLLLLAFTIIFCYLITPLVDFVEAPFRLRGKSFHIPHTLAILIVYLLMGTGIYFALERVVPILSEQLTALVANIPNYARELDQYAKMVAALPGRYRLPAQLRQSIDDGVNSVIPTALSWVQLLAQKAVRVTFYLPWLVLIPVIGFFFLKDANAISQKLLTSLPQADLRYRVALFLKDVSNTLASYIRAQLIACLLVGIIVGAGLWALGIPYPLVFAVVAGLLEFIPVVGPLTVGIAATLVASFSSWHIALLTAGFLTVYRIIHDYIIYPRLLSHGMEIHPVVVILAVLCGAELGGVIGVFLCVPAVSLLIVCWRHWRELQIDRSSTLIKSEETMEIEGLLISD